MAQHNQLWCLFLYLSLFIVEASILPQPLIETSHYSFTDLTKFGGEDQFLLIVRHNHLTVLKKKPLIDFESHKLAFLSLFLEH